MKIAVRFGHALLKNGLKTSANGVVNEYDIVREYGPFVINALIRNGFQVVNVTPPPRTFATGAPDLNQGIKNAAGCDIFVSLHLNCFNKQARGSEVLYGKGAVKSKQLAMCIQNEFINLGFINRGIKESNTLAELKQNNICVITEGFFVDNAEDVARYGSIGPQRFGEAIANGIIKYIKGISTPSQPTMTNPKVSVPLEKQFRIYGAKMMGNGLDETYAIAKAKQLKTQGYEVYYIKPNGSRINL